MGHLFNNPNMEFTCFFKSAKFIAILCSMTLFQCCTITPKGPARWDISTNAMEAKQKEVFVNGYEAQMFYYKDSITEIRLVVKEAFTEWWHWYDRSQNKYLSSLNSTTMAGQHLIVKLQKDSSCLAIHHYDSLLGSPYLYWEPEHKDGGLIVNEEGFSILPGSLIQFGDTIIIPIKSSIFYQRAANLPDYPRTTFGNLILTKSTDETKSRDY